MPRKKKETAAPIKKEVICENNHVKTSFRNFVNKRLCSNIKMLIDA